MTKWFLSKSLVLAVLVISGMTMVGCPSKDVVVVDEIDEIAVSDIENETITFRYAGDPSTPLEVGDIVVGTEGGGYLRRLMAVSESGTTVTAETEQVSLADAIEIGTLDADVTFTSKDFSDAGMKLAREATCTIDLSGTTLFNQDGVSLVITSGTITFAPHLQLDAVWKGHKLDSMTVLTTGTMAVDMNVRLQATKAASLSYEIDVLPPVTKPFVFYIGPVPVVGTASLKFPFGIVGRIDGTAAIETGFDSTSSVVLGGELYQGQWTDKSSLSDFAPNGHPVTWSLASAAGVDIFVKPEATLNLYGVSDLTGAVIPYIAADMKILPAPQQFVLAAGIDGVISYQLGIFDFNLVDESWFFPGPKWILYTWSSND